MIVCLGNLKRIYPKLRSEFIKIARYMVNIQKSTVLLYIYNEEPDDGIKKILFTITTTWNTWEKNSTKYVQVLYTDTTKPCCEKLKEIPQIGEVQHVHRLEDSVSIWCQFLPNRFLDSIANWIKILEGIFCRDLMSCF